MEDKKPNTPNKVEGNKKPEGTKQPFKKTFNKPFNKPFNKGGGGGPRRGRKPFRRPDRPVDDFEQKIVDLARVTRVMAGGKRMKFRACMVVGDKKGRVGIGLAKGVDVAMAISKSVSKAKKKTILVPIIDGTIPHEVNVKFKAARIMMKPARKGSGIKAGGVMRIILELAGVKDVVAKILGTNNKVNNAKAVLKALEGFVPTAVEAAKKDAPKKVAPKKVVFDKPKFKPAGKKPVKAEDIKSKK
ncbi:30S ribosomal protein S5 [Candidatus Parcubacteria bacterium]|jgi:small subunit ribosomal protein S5|nr:30S ribosomal protein S5 [Candidatus Parcubacteria bacterium]